MVRTLLVVFALIGLAGPVAAQKVKYKDLFILLNAKQYEQAEPFLRKYLAENDDNPNAYLFMGIILQDKAAKNDVLKHTEIMIGNLDSAVLFYDKAYKQIDEKEVKRNDEYYQAYNRRDLRTGKFGVKLSDVQFDLEKRMQALKERKELVQQLRRHFDDAQGYYTKTQFLYKDVQIKYKELKRLFLRSNDTTVTDLKRIASTFDSTLTAFNSYKETSSKIGKTGYNQEIVYKEITDLSEEGTSAADFMSDKVEMWNYKKWTDNTITGIQKEVMPMRDHLVTYDIEINKLREKLKKDSVSVKNDLTKLVDKMLYAQLQKYDPNPLPMGVFAMKISELEYLSELVDHKNFRDSANVKLHLEFIKAEIKEATKLDSIAGKLEARNLDEEVKDYSHFVNNAYGASTVLKSLIKTTKDFAEREVGRKQGELQHWEDALKWIVSEADSVPLFMEVGDTSKFKPMILVEEKYTAGFHFTDTTATGYFRNITPSRKADIAIDFPVDKKNFTLRRLPVIKALSASDDNGQVYYTLFYSQEKVNDKFPVTITKIYKTDGLAWSNNFEFEMLPVEVSFQLESGEVSVKTSNPAGESKMVFVDRNGKRKAAN
ncbi:MAG: hypothetical protein R2820_03330 [Cyclobacteriaceae bacterium]|nr:hypothetical protein [Cyclobacteriaceae bacterium]